VESHSNFEDWIVDEKPKTQAEPERKSLQCLCVEFSLLFFLVHLTYISMKCDRHRSDVLNFE
jgi:hypothetical protein